MGQIPAASLPGSEKKELDYINFLRMVAIFFVLLTHTSPNNSLSFYQQMPVLSFFQLMFRSLILCAVPVFFMLSGALLIDREETLKEIYLKRVLRFFIVLTVVSLIYQAAWCSKNGLPFAVIYYFQQLFDHTAVEPLWFLYSYLGMLIMLPILRKAAAAMSNKDFIYLAAAQLALHGVIPIILFIWTGGTASFGSQFSVELITAVNICFVLMGFYFEKRLGEQVYTGKNALIALAVGVVSLALCAAMTLYEMRLYPTDPPAASFSSSLVAVQAYALFFCAKYLFLKVSIGPFLKAMLRFFGSTAFGVYLMEGFLREWTEFVFCFMRSYTGEFYSYFVQILVACLLGSLITAILKRIPLIKKCI